MDDFEYSVHISDQDWECFFAECEACDLLPPSLAGVDDSGMSDIDDTGSIHTDKVLKVDSTAGVLEPNCPIDGPPDCEGFPLDVYLSKHGFGGMENVLSGIEGDIHLQSVNTFFERLKSLTEAEKLIETSQVGAGENREGAQGKELCSDGQQASNSSGALPKNIPRLNAVAARSETAVGKETTEPVAAISNINTMKKDEPGTKISPRPAANNSPLKTNKSAHPETEPFIRQQVCTQTAVNEVRRQSLSHESPDMDVCSGITTSDMCRPLDDVKQEDLLMSQSINQVAEEIGEEDRNSYFLQFDTDPKSTRDKSSQESFPFTSTKKKRRRRKRRSTEPNESEHGYKRNVSVKQSDSEEAHTWMGRIDPCLSVDNNLSHINETEKIDPTYLARRNLPLKTTAKDNEVNDLPHHIPQSDSLENVVRRRTCKVPGSPQSTTAEDRSATPTSQTNDSIMSNNCGNVATNLQPHTKSQTEELTILNLYPGLPISHSDCVSGKSGLATEMGNCEREDVRAGSLRQSDPINHSLTCWEIEQNPKSCAAEVISVIHSVLLSAESNEPAVEYSQNEVSAAKSLLAVQDGNSGRNNHTLCQREAEHSQQLEIVYHATQQYSSTCEKTRSPPSATVMITSDVQEVPVNNNKTQQSKTRPCSPHERLTEVTCAKFMLDTTDSSPDTLTEKIDVMVHHSENSLQSGEMIYTLTGNSEGEIKSVTPLSNENVTDMAGNACSSVCPSHFGGQGMVVKKNEEQDGATGFKSLAPMRDSAESKCDVTGGAEAGVAASLAECEPQKSPDSKHSAFAMSWFWSEKEKLTINDILGLRMIGDADTPSSLSPVRETEMPDMFTETDSGFFNQLDEAKPDEITEDTSTVPDVVESVSGTVVMGDPSTSRGVTWENEPYPVTLGASMYPEHMMLTPVSDIPEPLLAGSPQSVRKLSKNVSVCNLHALDSAHFSSMWKGQAAELDKEYFTDGHMPRQDTSVTSLPSSSLNGNASMDGYRISLTDIFKYFFGQKESTPSQSATENLTSIYIYGNSVPETYDHFFTEFDTESLFSNPFAKDEPVPTFSSSRSANTNLQFPEAYEYFFASSSSDDSSTESDEEEDCGPVRVVSRFSHKTDASQISTDIYENFFTDRDLGENLFWKSTFSFRNVHLMRWTSQTQSSNTLPLQPVRQLSRTPQRVIPTISETFQEPFLFHPEDRISRQLAQQCFIRYEDPQTAVSNPRLDASLLPLRQSDMCLVCIALASWVLMSANPQVGDAWKAVLLANVSAFSAIRYLRKYKRVEAAASEKELHHAAA